MSIQPGQTILNGKYRIQRLIGEGGMARVWLAEELTFGGRQVALKEPRDNLLPEHVREVRQRYQREVQVCAALDKARVPNIVRAITADPYEDTLLLAMEYMPGGDLAALLKEHPEGLPIEQAVGITLDLLQALEGVHAHELEIVHRDVKPSNVLFDEEGKAHLADFGLAQLAGVSGRSQLAGGQHPGTPMYMAPEQESSPRTLTPAADLYAVGCVLFEMLTGTRYKRVRPGTSVRALRSEVPGWLGKVVAQALAEDPWDRFQHAGELTEQLRVGEDRVGTQGVAIKISEANLQQRREAVEDGKQRVQKTKEEPLAQLESKEKIAPVWQQIGIEMVTIPRGRFLYGESRVSDYLPEYALARTPVTNAQYKRFVDATGYRIPHHWRDGRIPPGKEEHPVVEVDWFDAQAFCRWAGCRLPTAKEWEKGARGTDGRKYPWGNRWMTGHCNTKEARTDDTTPVERYADGASPYGLLDMAGNAYDWCEDWTDNHRTKKLLKGGSWLNPQIYAKPEGHGSVSPSGWGRDIGFRCCLSRVT